jgi:hypothetical protein
VIVKVFVEGGGDNEDTITRCRQGFASYCAKAAPGKPRPRIVPCGGKNQTIDKFKTAIQASSRTGELCVLLVDSEGPVGANSPVAHLSVRDRWNFPSLSHHQVFLMVQAMEAWFLADRQVLAAFYDGGFLANSLPGSPRNVEAVLKDDLEHCLKHASVPTRSKGEYHKVKHGFALLGLIDPSEVEKGSPHAKRFNDFLRGL